MQTDPNQLKLMVHLSYDIAVIQWMTSYHKNRMTTRVITLLRIYVILLTTSLSITHFHAEIMFILKTIKSHFKGSYENRILQSYSFHMKFMKLAKCSFN